MFREQTSDKASPVSTVLGLILLLVPFFLSITWGLYFRDSVFILLQAAQELTGGLGKAAPEFVSGMLTQAPLYVGLMAAAGSLAPQVGLIVCALGWSATAWLVFYALRAAGRPLAALITPVLLVFSPLVITTLGTEYSWVLALGWACMALTVFPPTRRRWAAWLKPVLLLLLLGLHFNAATILFALALLAVDIYNGRAGWLPFILVAASSFLWGFFMIPRAGGPPAVDPVLWLQNGATLMASRQLVWLYVPFILAGLWDVWVWEEAPGRDAAQGAPTEGQQFFALLILWAAAAVLARSPAAPIIAAVTAAALAGLGAAWLVRRVLAPGRLEIDPRRAAVFVPVLITMPLLLAGLLTLWDLYHTRPVQQADLQDQAAAWLAANADAGATLFAPPRAGYLAGRATIPALVERISDGNVDAVYGQLLSHTPQFIVSEELFCLGLHYTNNLVPGTVPAPGAV